MNNTNRPSYYEIYDELVLKMLPFYPDMHTEIVKLIDRRPDDKPTILELGFGTGTLTKRIFSQFPNAKIIGIDNLEENTKKALPKLKSYNFEYKLGNFNNLDGSMNNVDYIVSALAVHHLTEEEKKALFKKAYEILPTGGRLITGDIVESEKEEEWHKYLVESMGEEGEYRWQRHKNSKDDKPSALEEQISWLREAGFKEVKNVAEWFNFNVFYGEK